MRITPTAETIWERPAYLPCVNPPLTDELIYQTEKRLGCKLPSEFLDLLRVQNGGAIRFAFPERIGDSIAGIGPANLRSSCPSINNYYLSEQQEYVDYQLDGLVPFDGDGHWFYCIDYRDDQQRPCISYIDVECSSEKRRVADSFSDFLQCMELKTGTKLVLQGVKSLNDARERLEAIFGCTFDDNISYFHGVACPTLQVGNSTREQFWITSNRVARWYMGERPNFEYEGATLLFPELDCNAVLWDASGEHTSVYRSQIQDAGLQMVDIYTAANAT